MLFRSVLDVDDRCPMEPETHNRYRDADGCPDRRPFRATRGQIHLLEKIYFETDRATIRPVSLPLLDAIAAFLRDTPTIRLVEIQGHADERGTEAHNLALTRARAAAVRRRLVDRGVAAKRLRARGYGERRPLDRRHTPEAWSRNRRVQLIVLRRAP